MVQIRLLQEEEEGGYPFHNIKKFGKTFLWDATFTVNTASVRVCVCV